MRASSWTRPRTVREQLNIERGASETVVGPESIFCVPHGDPGERLIGRDAILEQLDATLSTAAGAGPTLRTALQGTGGIGKTQLAARHPDVITQAGSSGEHGRPSACRQRAAKLGRTAPFGYHRPERSGQSECCPRMYSRQLRCAARSGQSRGPSPP
jgi:hypothetical protein